MILSDLISRATNKEKFTSINQYIDFCSNYLRFVDKFLQARIVSKNESHYQFFQYQKDGHFNITRPLNMNLMYDSTTFERESLKFVKVLEILRNKEIPSDQFRENIIRSIYTIQQSLGATLDALPSGQSNQARKLNGDLFERFIRLLIKNLNIECVSGTVQVPIRDLNEKILFQSTYQHDLLISKNSELKVIGSVKTSSKDRIDKVFMDKFLYSRLTETSLPHIAIFLNDVQRKKTKKENEYGVSATFLPGHFKAYTIKLNPLDGVYYCDIRPNMKEDMLLSSHIRTIDELFYTDLWQFIDSTGQNLQEIKIEGE